MMLEYLASCTTAYHEVQPRLPFEGTPQALSDAFIAACYSVDTRLSCSLWRRAGVCKASSRLQPPEDELLKCHERLQSHYRFTARLGLMMKPVILQRKLISTSWHMSSHCWCLREPSPQLALNRVQHTCICAPCPIMENDALQNTSFRRGVTICCWTLLGSMVSGQTAASAMNVSGRRYRTAYDLWNGLHCKCNFQLDHRLCAGYQWASRRWREMQSASGEPAQQ